MAWRCSGTSNEELIFNLQKAEIVTSDVVRDAMLLTDRGIYVPDPPSGAHGTSKTYSYGPYADVSHLANFPLFLLTDQHLANWFESTQKLVLIILDGACMAMQAPQELGFKVTVSAPHIHAAALEILADRITAPNARCLDVGCGSGVLLAYMARMGPPKTVVGVEVVPELVTSGIANLFLDNLSPNSEDSHLVVRESDGWGGAADLGPFDAIHVGAFAPRVPQALLEQLRPGGRMVIPIGNRETQVFTQVDKDADGEFTLTHHQTVRFVALVDTGGGGDARGGSDVGSRTGSGTIDWTGRYKKGWAYGKDPSAFLVAAAKYLSQPCRVLCLFEGQGRNAVYLASLGHLCTVVDVSEVGLAKARLLAEQRGVPLDRLVTIAADLTQWTPAPAAYDAVISIFGCGDPAKRSQLHRACATALAPGGMVIVEAFAPRHAAVRGNSALGPPNDQLVSISMLIAEFAGLEPVMTAEVEQRLHEGRFHRGLAVLSHFVACKGVTGTLRYRDMVDWIFHERCKGDRLDRADHRVTHLADQAMSEYAQIKPPPRDPILACATAAIQIACEVAHHKRVCRYCWVPSHACFCDAIRPILAPSKRGAGRLRFKVLCHPTEFLRSTSSAKVAVQVLAYSELLVVGAESHRGLIDAALNCRGPMFVLYPGSAEESVTVAEAHSIAASAQFACDATAGFSDVAATTTILVPDGSWQCTRALLHDLEGRTMAKPLVRVRLNEDRVARCTSPLIDALKPGQGLGRISTLEAIALFLSEAAEIEAIEGSPRPWDVDVAESGHLLQGLIPVVQWVKTLHALPESGDLNACAVSLWAEALHTAAAATVAPQGLRHCSVCGETLATPIRLTQHIRGRKHCVAVAQSYLLRHGHTTSDEVSAAGAVRVLQTFSTDMLANSVPEPPDCALVAITHALANSAHGRALLPEKDDVHHL
jgi:protein-L-isoaspartate(D-aspartate) O-methyltransferase